LVCRGSDAELCAEEKEKLVASIKDMTEGLASQKRVERLREIQGQYDKLEAKLFEERAALEDKYQKLYEPLCSKRYKIVNGVIESEGVTKQSAYATPSEQKSSGDETAADEKKEQKGLPAFWLNAMKNHEFLAMEIEERDEEALKYLKDIRWYRISGQKGFKLEFHFDTNPFFKNSVLTKTYHMFDEDGGIPYEAIGTKIDWYHGKCLTQKVLKKKHRKGSNMTKPITKTENCESFFNFFSPRQAYDIDEEMDTEEEFFLRFKDHYMGSMIRYNIIPRAVSWFTGEAAQDEDKEGEESEDDYDTKMTKGAAGGEWQHGELPVERQQ